MSVLRPVGPLPARVYWVRRLLVLALAVALLLVAAWAWGAVRGDEAGTGATPGGSPGPTTSGTTPSPTTSGSPSPSASKTPSPTPSPSESGPQPCKDKVIQAVATPSATTYAAGVDPRFTIKVTNTSKKTCTRDVGQKAMELRVQRGDTLVWSSDHCAPGGEAKVLPLKAGQSYTTSVVWSRTLSEKGCPDDTPEAPAGTYSLVGRNLDVVSEPAAFALQ